MKNRELIALLQALPPDQEAVIAQTGGASTASSIRDASCLLVRDPNTGRRKGVIAVWLHKWGEGKDYIQAE